MKKLTDEDLIQRYEVDANGCWIWTGGTFGRYGAAGSDRLPNGKYRTRGAHQWSYRYHHGPIPEGMCVCHTCDVPMCIRPDHLFLDTHDGNMEDRQQKGRTALSHRRHLTKEQVDAILADPRSSRKVAAEYGINKTTVNRIRQGVIYNRW